MCCGVCREFLHLLHWCFRRSHLHMAESTRLKELAAKMDTILTMLDQREEKMKGFEQSLTSLSQRMDNYHNAQTSLAIQPQGTPDVHTELPDAHTEIPQQLCAVRIDFRGLMVRVPCTGYTERSSSSIFTTYMIHIGSRWHLSIWMERLFLGSKCSKNQVCFQHGPHLLVP